MSEVKIATKVSELNKFEQSGGEIVAQQVSNKELEVAKMPPVEDLENARVKLAGVKLAVIGGFSPVSKGDSSIVGGAELLINAERDSSKVGGVLGVQIGDKGDTQIYAGPTRKIGGVRWMVGGAMNINPDGNGGTGFGVTAGVGIDLSDKNYVRIQGTHTSDPTEGSTDTTLRFVFGQVIK